MDDGAIETFNFFFIFIQVLEINMRRATLIKTSTFSIAASTISSIL